MTIYHIIYSVVLFSTCGLAFVKGQSAERLTAFVLIVASFASAFVVKSAFTKLELGISVIDVAVFVFLLGISLASNRFWPLWAAAFQAAGILVIAARLIDMSMAPLVYATAEAFWAYPVLAALGIGTWFEVQGPTNRTS